MRPAIFNLTNGGSKNLNVNGSLTPQTFTYSPGAGNIAIVTGLTCLLQDEGTTSFNKFGAITALTNGITVQITIGGVSTIWATIKDNADLCTRFNTNNQFGNSAVLSVLGIVTAQGFGGSNNVFAGIFRFPSEYTVTLSDSDSISVTINDNLTAIDSFQMAVNVVKV